MRQFALCFLSLFCMFPLLAQTPAGEERVSVYQSGAEKFEALLSDMSRAQHHLHVEYFIFANDSIANQMLSVMRQKASEGVEVRLIIDGYYDVKRHYDHRKRLSQLKSDGIEVQVYNPYVFPYVTNNLRDHRKIVVIDGKVGYTGGFNVADYNIKGKPGIYGAYIDTHVRLEGESVKQLDNLFLEHYNRLSGENIASSAFAESSVSIVARGTKDHRKKEMRKAVIAFIDSAERELYIQSPYLLPTPGIRQALRRALKRGVKVHVMFSEKGDTPLFDLGNLSYARQLQRRGADVWLYRNAFLHSKVLTADGEKCMVGSMNLDYRAMRMNEEVGAIIYDAKTTLWLDSAFVAAKENCKAMDDVYYGNLPYKTRICGRLIDYFGAWGL